jgi:hypothetical protein
MRSENVHSKTQTGNERANALEFANVPTESSYTEYLSRWRYQDWVLDIACYQVYSIYTNRESIPIETNKENNLLPRSLHTHSWLKFYG